MTTLRKGRLERLANLLETDLDRDGGPKFDLSDWGEVERVKHGGFFGIGRETVLCHTTACAVGLACISGEFQEDGLRMHIDYDQIEPIFAEEFGTEAAMKFFGITEKQFIHMFCEASYDGPTRGPKAALAVAARIRKLIKRKKTVKLLPTTAAVEKIKKDALEHA